MWGVGLTMMDVLNKHFQTVLGISKSRSALIQLSTFGAYTVVALPVGNFLRKYGYKKAILLGLLLYAAGSFLFIPAANSASFAYFLIALFVLASGMASLETVAHPLIASLGHQNTSDQRINLAQSFNGLGGVIGPIIGSYFLLNIETRQAGNLETVQNLYITIGALMTIMAAVFAFTPLSRQAMHLHTKEEVFSSGDKKEASNKLWHQKHFVFAVVAQFFNVAAQAGTWAYFINYGHEVMHFTAEKAGYFFSLSIFLLVIGRFFGTYLMRYIAPFKLLAVFSLCNIAMCILVSQGAGWLSYGALLMINFFFSIMYPTIFSLGLKDLGKRTHQASSYIVMGFLGGAIFPPLMGIIADKDLAASYYLPIVCYIVIFLFGFRYPLLNKNLRAKNYRPFILQPRKSTGA